MQITSNIDKIHVRPKGVPSNDEFRHFSMAINSRFNSIVSQRPRGQLASGYMTDFNRHRVIIAVDHGTFKKHYTIDRWD